MCEIRRVACRALILLPLALVVGCPHRSPVWSPDGRHLLVLVGARGEEIDQAASQLWLLEVESGRATFLEPPEDKTRYLGAAWIDKDRFLVVAGRWEDDVVVEGSGKFWLRSTAKGEWKQVPAPAPSEERVPRRPPVVLQRGDQTLLAYPSGSEAVVVSSLESGKEILRLQPAELVGPGTGGGFLIYRPEAGQTGDTELVAYTRSLEKGWQTRFSVLRAEMALKLGKKAVEIVFNDTSTSHLPLATRDPAWVAVTLVFADVGWRDGIPGYYVQLGAKDGKLCRVAEGLGLSGRPTASGTLAWYVKAPDPDTKKPPTLEGVALTDGSVQKSLPLYGLTKEAVHGYSVDPGGKMLALSVNADSPTLRIYTLEGTLSPAKPVFKEFRLVRTPSR